MKRAEFLKNLGLSGAAIMATYCLGSLTACSNEEPKPAASTTNPDNNNSVFILDLNDQANSALQANGGFIYKSGVIVARTKDGNYVAVSQACTHQGVPVTYKLDKDQFNCPLHQSNFSTTGSVANGPATTPLKQYKVELNSSTNTLRVFEG
jgi:cytochrome b6-f complex iron-sulfur subunit